jgi:hypothetical protein
MTFSTKLLRCAALAALLQLLTSTPGQADAITTLAWKEQDDFFRWKFEWDGTAFDGLVKPDELEDDCRKAGSDCWFARVARTKATTEDLFSWQVSARHVIEADQDDDPEGAPFSKIFNDSDLAETNKFKELFDLEMVTHTAAGPDHEDLYTLSYERPNAGGAVVYDLHLHPL